MTHPGVKNRGTHNHPLAVDIVHCTSAGVRGVQLQARDAARPAAERGGAPGSPRPGRGHGLARESRRWLIDSARSHGHTKRSRRQPIARERRPVIPERNVSPSGRLPGNGDRPARRRRILTETAGQGGPPDGGRKQTRSMRRRLLPPTPRTPGPGRPPPHAVKFRFAREPRSGACVRRDRARLAATCNPRCVPVARNH